MWDLIVPVPDHCLSFYFNYAHNAILICIGTRIHTMQERVYAVLIFT